MRIINGRWPPNIDAIAKVFPLARRKQTIVFAYEDAIFNPWSIDLPIWIRMHEGEHGARQMGHPEEWWERYLTDKQFRLQEELFAHAAELKSRSEALPSRQQRRAALADIAGKISGALYDNMINDRTARVMLKSMAFGEAPVGA